MDPLATLPNLKFEINDDLTKGVGDFLPNIKLLQGVSTEIGQASVNAASESHENVAGEFYIPVKNINLGSKVTIVVVHRREHAIKLDNNAKVLESYQADSPVFQEIKKTKEDRENGLIVLFGYEWLLWIPSIREFVTYFAARKSARGVSGEINSYLAPPDQRPEVHKDLKHTNQFELFSEFASFGKKRRCHVPHVTAVEIDKALHPPPDKFEEALKTFQIAVEQETTVVIVDQPCDR